MSWSRRCERSIYFRRHKRVLELLAGGPRTTEDLARDLKKEGLFRHDAKHYEVLVRGSLERHAEYGEVVEIAADQWELVQQDSPDHLTITLKLPRTATEATAKVEEDGNVVIEIRYA